VLRVSWRGYQTLLREVADGAARLTFDNGLLEIAVPGRRHEELKKLAAALTEMVLNRKRVSYTALGSTTWFRESRLRGLEADECYVLGPAAEKLKGKKTVDLSVDPPPDFALEVEIASSAVDKLAVYAGIGVREVWRINEQGRVTLFQLNDSGTYQEMQQSVAIPELTPALLAEHLSQLDSLGYSGVVWKFEDRLPELLNDRQG
jgi:Uma2 family endonuclease